MHKNVKEGLNKSCTKFPTEIQQTTQRFGRPYLIPLSIDARNSHKLRVLAIRIEIPSSPRPVNFPPVFQTFLFFPLSSPPYNQANFRSTVAARSWSKKRRSSSHECYFLFGYVFARTCVRVQTREMFALSKFNKTGGQQSHRWQSARPEISVAACASVQRCTFFPLPFHTQPAQCVPLNCASTGSR